MCIMVIILVRTEGDDAYEVYNNIVSSMIDAPERLGSYGSGSDGGGGGDTFPSPPFIPP